MGDNKMHRFNLTAFGGSVDSFTLRVLTAGDVWSAQERAMGPNQERVPPHQIEAEQLNAALAEIDDGPAVAGAWQEWGSRTVDMLRGAYARLNSLVPKAEAFVLASGASVDLTKCPGILPPVIPGYKVRELTTRQELAAFQEAEKRGNGATARRACLLSAALAEPALSPEQVMELPAQIGVAIEATYNRVNTITQVELEDFVMAALGPATPAGGASTPSPSGVGSPGT